MPKQHVFPLPPFSILIAFILEAFFVEYSLEKSEVETAIERKIQELGVGIQE